MNKNFVKRQLFNIDTDSAHRALKDCEMCKKIYDKIKIIGLPKEDRI